MNRGLGQENRVQGPPRLTNENIIEQDRNDLPRRHSHSQCN